MTANHLVIGDGAVGVVLASLVARAGFDVRMAARSVAAPHQRWHGVRSLHGPDLDAVLDVVPLAPLHRRASVAWVAVKAPGLQATVDSGVLDDVDLVVPLLNGLDPVDVLQHGLSRVNGPPDRVRVSAGAIRVLAARETDGRVTLASRVPEIALAGGPGVAAAAADLERAGMGVAVGGTDAEVLWGKAAYFLPLGLATLVADGPVGRARRDRGLWARVQEAARELVDLARFDGVALVPQDVLRELDSSPATMTTSLLRDARAGVRGEFDRLYDALRHRSTIHACPCPVTLRLVHEARVLRENGGDHCDNGSQLWRRS